jgi:hypothetical protein
MWSAWGLVDNTVGTLGLLVQILHERKVALHFMRQICDACGAAQMMQLKCGR